MGFSRQEYWNGSPCPSPGDLPNPGIEPVSPAAPVLQVDPLPLSQQGSPGKKHLHTNNFRPAIWILIDRMVLTLQMKKLSFTEVNMPMPVHGEVGICSPVVVIPNHRTLFHF